VQRFPSSRGVLTRVVQVRQAKFVQFAPGNVYIGRDYAEFVNEGWGNPFHIGPDGNREEVLAKYRKWALGNPYLLKRLHLLKDKVLGCWCRAGECCHGDVLVELVELTFGESAGGGL
jgi:hypothetical protein